MDMKFIITEDKLYRAFSKFMDNYFGLKYHIIDNTILGIDMKEYIFKTKDGESFGRSFENDAFKCNFDKYNILNSFFGDKTDELLLQYLNDKFGDSVRIRRIS